MLYVGLGNDEHPKEVPHCIAYHVKQPNPQEHSTTQDDIRPQSYSITDEAPAQDAAKPHRYSITDEAAAQEALTRVGLGKQPAPACSYNCTLHPPQKHNKKRHCKCADDWLADD